jgi:GNAT superfamily N-acetyltransferase
MPGARTSLATPRGKVGLVPKYSAALLAHVHPDDGLRVFAETPEGEHAMLRRKVEHGARVSVALTDENCLVGAAWMEAASDWWAGLPAVQQFTLEISRGWRRMGLGTALMRLALASAQVDQAIVLAIGFAWHWDIAIAGIEEAQYSSVLRSLLAKFGFQAVQTSEPNVRLHAANFLMVRIGAKVTAAARAAFAEARFIAPAERQQHHA